jgi:KDO2-lipid IV(A) lauroyltransferase
VLTRVALGVVWLLRLLPLTLLAPLGRGLGFLFYLLGRERREVALTNLGLCFPQWSESDRRRVARAHFRAFGRGVVEHGILWWSSKERVQRLVRMEDTEHVDALAGRPVILLAPHFIGLDMGGIRMSAKYRGVSVYSRQKDATFDEVLYHGRTRFEPQELYSRREGVRSVIKALRRGLLFHYSPDMDFGSRDSIFVPFFGVPAATVTGLSRMARLAGAVVVPAVTRQLPGAGGYVLTFYPAWRDFPTDDVERDTRRMNAFIEERVLEMPEQYYWLHKRFKTRPPGEPRFY